MKNKKKIITRIKRTWFMFKLNLKLKSIYNAKAHIIIENGINISDIIQITVDNKFAQFELSYYDYNDTFITYIIQEINQNLKLI